MSSSHVNLVSTHILQHFDTSVFICQALGQASLRKSRTIVMMTPFCDSEPFKDVCQELNLHLDKSNVAFIRTTFTKNMISLQQKTSNISNLGSLPTNQK